MEIEFLTEKYIEDVFILWRKTFGDDEEFIKSFFACWQPEKHTLILREEHCVLGMLSLLPVSANGVKGRYIYAVATEQAARKRGIATRLLSAAEEAQLKQSEKFSVLVPSSENLFEFYEKRGWNEILYAPDFSKINMKDTQKISTEEYLKKRKKFFSKRDLIEWDKAALFYMKKYGKFIKSGENAAFLWDGEMAEVLAKDARFAEEKPFALIKYYGSFKLNNPYFGIAMN